MLHRTGCTSRAQTDIAGVSAGWRCCLLFYDDQFSLEALTVVETWFTVEAAVCSCTSVRMNFISLVCCMQVVRWLWTHLGTSWQNYLASCHAPRVVWRCFEIARCFKDQSLHKWCVLGKQRCCNGNLRKVSSLCFIVNYLNRFMNVYPWIEAFNRFFEKVTKTVLSNRGTVPFVQQGAP